MDQGSDNIRQNIDSTRDALTEKLDALEVKARETFDLKHQVAERPWMALGAAVAAGYVLGSLGGSDSETRYDAPTTSGTSASYTPPARPSNTDSFMSQFDDEIAMLKGAAMSTLTGFLRDAVREFAPAISAQLGSSSTSGRGFASASRGTPSTAPGVSMSEYRDQPAINSESIPMTTSYGSNEADRTSAHATPYYPPGSQSDTFRADNETTVGSTRSNR